MSEKDNGRITLSRRKALAALGASGAAVGLGGLGTYAQFTDTEEQEITFSAGGIDGTIAVSGSYNGSQLDDELAHVEVAEGGVGTGLELTDIKPGDYGCLVFELEVRNNPAWVGSCVGYEDNIDATTYEPEVDAADEPHDLSGVSPQDYGDQSVLAQTEGELASNLLLLPFYDSDLQCGFFDSGGPPELAPQDLQDVSVPSNFWSNLEGPSQPPQSVQAADGYLAPRTLEDIVNSDGSLNTIQWNGGGWEVCEAPEGYEVEDGCVFLNGDESADDSDNTQEAAPLQPGNTLQFGYDWHLPFDVGNEAQGDSVTVNLGFTFSQLRHTESQTLQNIYAPGENTPNGGN